jgi:hypothetical protein
LILINHECPVGFDTLNYFAARPGGPNNSYNQDGYGEYNNSGDNYAYNNGMGDQQYQQQPHQPPGMYNGGIPPVPGGGPQMIRNNPNNKQPMRGLPMIVPDPGVQPGQMMNSNPYAQQQQHQQHHLPPPQQQTSAAAPSSSPFSFFGIGNNQHHQQQPQQHYDQSHQQQQSTGTSFFSKITSIGVGGGVNTTNNTAATVPGATTQPTGEGLLSKGKDLFKKFGL